MSPPPKEQSSYTSGAGFRSAGDTGRDHHRPVGVLDEGLSENGVDLVAVDVHMQYGGVAFHIRISEDTVDGPGVGLHDCRSNLESSCGTRETHLNHLYVDYLDDGTQSAQCCLPSGLRLVGSNKNCRIATTASKL